MQGKSILDYTNRSDLACWPYRMYDGSETHLKCCLIAYFTIHNFFFLIQVHPGPDTNRIQCRNLHSENQLTYCFQDWHLEVQNKKHRKVEHPSEKGKRIFTKLICSKWADASLRYYQSKTSLNTGTTNAHFIGESVLFRGLIKSSYSPRGFKEH